MSDTERHYSNTRTKWRGYLVVLGGILVHLTLGTVYTFGNMSPYITSYFRIRGVNSSLTYGDSTWVFALTSMAQGTTVFFGGLISRRLGPRLTTLLGSWVASLGVFLTYFTIKQSFAAFVVTYGLMFGLGIGVAYAVPMDCAMKWMPHRKGLISGLVVAGFGGGSFIFDQIQTAYINPRNEKADRKIDGEDYFYQKEILDRVPTCFLLLGGCYSVMQLVGCLMLVDPPEYMQTEITISETKEEQQLLLDEGLKETNAKIREEDISLTPLHVIRSRVGWTIWLILLVNGQGVQFISALYKAYGQTFIKDDRFLALVGSLSSVFNGVGRIAWGFLADRHSVKLALVLYSGCFTILMLTFIVTSVSGKALFLVYVCLIFLAFSGTFSLLSAATARCFGQQHYGINYGFIFSANIITAPIGAVLASQLVDVVGWSGMFFLTSGFCFIGLLLSISFNAKTRSGESV